jgi:nitrite reductase/ring-hydroxylating ferredoxin subunit
MERKEFLRQCSFVCLGTLGLGTLLESCGTSKSLSGQLNDKRLTIPLTQFASSRNGQVAYKRYVIVRNEALNYPIIVYRESAAQYTALLLRCTHQYNELNVSGELLTCPAHGSEFNNKGEAVQGPAEAKLRQFPTSTDADNLYIELA